MNNSPVSPKPTAKGTSSRGNRKREKDSYSNNSSQSVRKEEEYLIGIIAVAQTVCRRCTLVKNNEKLRA